MPCASLLLPSLRFGLANVVPVTVAAQWSPWVMLRRGSDGARCGRALRVRRRLCNALIYAGLGE
jgi:hypothetical protein